MKRLNGLILYGIPLAGLIASIVHAPTAAALLAIYCGAMLVTLIKLGVPLGGVKFYRPGDDDTPTGTT